MSEVAGLVALSHAPFINLFPTPAPGEAGSGFLASAAALRHAVAACAPDAAIVIGPDHFHANFYDSMPPFTIGAGTAEGFGDYGSRGGPVEVATDLAWAVFGGVTDAGFDPALSLAATIDHGIVQALQLLWPGAPVPIVPVIVNCAGPPLPSLTRCAELGAALGAAVRAAPGGSRVLVVASGGLSHWIPATDPRDPTMDQVRRDGLVHGRKDRQAFSDAREPKVRALGGTRTARVAEDFDHWFLDLVAQGRWDGVTGLGDDEVLARAGNGGQEIRTWLMGLAAAETPVAWTAYEAVPEWLTGMGVASTLPEVAA